MSILNEVRGMGEGCVHRPNRSTEASGSGVQRIGIGGLFGVLILLLLVPGCRKRNDGLVYDESFSSSTSRRGRGELMYGRVVDRNDKPLKRVTIVVSPGNTELITNRWGEYEIDKLHAEDGTRIRLITNQDYSITAWKPGYHETTQIFRYEGKMQEIPTITLIEDSIELDPENAVPIIPTEPSNDEESGAIGRSVENE